MFRGLQIESPHIFNIRILISSWQWTLFGSKLLIIRRMSSFVKWQEDNVLSAAKVIQKVRRFHLKLKGIGQRKRNWKCDIFLENQQYIYPHEIEEEFSICLTSSTYCYYLDHPVFEQFCQHSFVLLYEQMI